MMIANAGRRLCSWRIPLLAASGDPSIATGSADPSFGTGRGVLAAIAARMAARHPPWDQHQTLL
eukprot:1998243-Rhodomonas_salina.1